MEVIFFLQLLEAKLSINALTLGLKSKVTLRSSIIFLIVLRNTDTETIVIFPDWGGFTCTSVNAAAAHRVSHRSC